MLHRCLRGRHLLARFVQAVDVQPSRNLATIASSRSPEYAEVSQSDLDYFKEVVGTHGVITDADALDPLNRFSSPFLTSTTRWFERIYMKESSGISTCSPAHTWVDCMFLFRACTHLRKSGSLTRFSSPCLSKLNTVCRKNVSHVKSGNFKNVSNSCGVACKLKPYWGKGSW